MARLELPPNEWKFDLLHVHVLWRGGGGVKGCREGVMRCHGKNTGSCKAINFDLLMADDECRPATAENNNHS